MAVVVLCTLAACHQAALPKAAPVRSELAGLRARLILDPDLGLAVEGSVEDTPAEVALDIASPLTTVSTGCFPMGPPSSPGTVRVPRPEGGYAALPEIWLTRARLGPAEVGGRKVALVRGLGCVLALGSDVLGPYALQVDFSRRELVLAASRPRADYLVALTASEPPSEEVHVVELSRDPGTDWPLLSVRLRQGRAILTGPFVLSTRDAQSLLSGDAAARAGLVSERDGLRELGLTAGIAGPPSYAPEGLELLPGLALVRARLVGIPRWSNPGAFGVLGADVWGRFRITLDAKAEVMVLRRPRVLASGALQLCAKEAGGGFSEESCHSLDVTPRPHGIEGIATVWRNLPEGGRLYLQPLDEEGHPLDTSCRAGLTLEPADRGTRIVFRLPWEGLSSSLPACASEWARARGVALARFEEGSLPKCPGDCSFVVHLLTRQVRCDCPRPGPSRISGGGRRLLERLRSLPGLQGGPTSAPTPAGEPEPDPGP